MKDMSNGNTATIDAENIVNKYLQSFVAPQSDDGWSMAQSFERVTCCESSCSLYCNRCCSLLVRGDALPIPISLRRRIIMTQDMHSKEERPLRLPFNLHIVLDDRRKSATGLHAVALLNGGTTTKDDGNEVQLIDVTDNDMIPRYQEQEDAASTYLLFPCPGESIPLESVASKARTLVVLDCKWTKSSICRTDNSLSKLQKVHLSSPPKDSNSWRWHNAGPGRISTIEAIYYAAFEVWQIKKQQQSKDTISYNDISIDQNNLIHLLWIFGHQRAATFRSAQSEEIPHPCSDEGKAIQREMRRQKGTWRQLRHKEDERRLRERNKLKEEKKVSSNT